MPKPLRSVLFVPGNRADRFDKAISSGADAVIFDLEDSVPVGHLDNARRVVGDFVAARGSAGPALFVRIGAPASDAQALDIEAVCRPGLSGVVVPKLELPADVRLVDAALAASERAVGMSEGSTAIVPALETPLAIRNTFDLVQASARVAYVVGGTSDQGDVARGLGFQWTPEGLESLYIRSKVILDARAAGIAFPLTGVWSRVADLDGFGAFARQGRQLGYRGILVIHPSHVAAANEAFSPTRAEVEHWRRLIEHTERLHSDGDGAGTMDGVMVETAVVETARANLTWAAALGLVEEVVS